MSYAKLLSFAVVVVFAMGASTAQAASGWLTGQFLFQNLNGNCGVGAGSKYPCNDPLCPGGDLNGDNVCDADGVPIDPAIRSFNKANQGVQGVHVTVFQAGTTAAIGEGWTNADGTWSVSWDDGNIFGNAQLGVNVRWETRHQTGKFQVGNNLYQNWGMTIGTGGTQTVFTAMNGQTVGIGAQNWNANAIASQYEGARAVWNNAFARSARLVALYGENAGVCPPGATCPTQGQPIPNVAGAFDRVHVDTSSLIQGGCPGAAAWAQGTINTVCLGPAAVNQTGNISRVQHELGHIAEFVSNSGATRYGGVAYTRDDPACCALPTTIGNDCCIVGPLGGCTYDGVIDCNIHGLTTQEWAEPMFTEGIATHWAHVANYTADHTAPLTCVNAAQCTAANGLNVESMPNVAGDGTACAAGGNRMEINAMRYFWDTYDTQVENTAAGATVDDLTRGEWHMADTLNAFAATGGNNGRDEVRQSVTTQQLITGSCNRLGFADPEGDGINNCDPDGHSLVDFAAVWQARGILGEFTNSSTELNGNCGTVGD